MKAADNGKTEVVRRYIGMGVDVDWQDGVSVCATHEGTALFHGERSRTRELIRGNPAPAPRTSLLLIRRPAVPR